MSYLPHFKVGHWVLIMLGLFLLLLACFIYTDYAYISNVRPDQRAKQKFLPVDCLVISKKLSSKGRLFHRYRADFLITYHAGSVQYNRWVSGNGLDRSHTRSSSSQTQLLADYDTGKNYTCWYDPENPEYAYLVERSTWSLVYAMLLPVLASVVMLCFFLVSVKRVWHRL